jgi:tetratricopeptide (TPR) repeat protein
VTTRLALGTALLSFALGLGCSTDHKQLNRAIALQQSGKTTNALEIYEQLVTHARSKSAQSQIYVHIGECEWTLERQSDALNAFLKAAELDSSNTSADLHLAQLFLAGGAPDRALVFADIVLSHEPKNLDAMSAAAGAHAYLGNMAAATSGFEEVLKQDPGRPEAAITLSQIYSSTDRPADGRTVLLTASAKSPTSAPVQLALAHFEEEQGHIPEAEAAYRKALKLKDDADTNLRFAQFLERSARLPEAEVVLRKVDTMSPAKPFALADFQIVSGKGSDASRHYLDLLLQHENSSTDKTAAALAARAIEAKLSLTNQQTGSKRDQTLLEAKTALGTHRNELGPAMTSVLAAEIELVQGDAVSAETLARGAVEARSDSPSANYVLGLALSRLGKNTEARTEWQTVIDDDPSFVPARLSLAELSLSEGNPSDAEQMVVPVVRQEPANLAALDLFARVLIAEKEFASANSIAMRYQAIDKASPESHLLLGESALAQHRLAYSLIEFEQAVLLDPTSAAAMDGLVRVYRMGTITRPMLQHMEHSAAAQPTSPTLMELAGRLYTEHGWNDDAMRCLRNALLMDPKRSSAAVQLAALETRKGDTEAATSSAAKASATSSLLLSAVEADDASNDPAAVRAYEEALKRGDGSGVAANNLAWIYARQGTNLDRALELAQRAREADPINPAVTDTLGYVLLKRHEYSMAVAALKRADDQLKARKSSDTELAAAIHAHLAEAYRNSGEKDSN